MRVELQNVKKAFSDKTILDVENLVLEEGRIIALLGPNGAGKTSMLRCVAGIDMARSGHIYYNGVKDCPNKCIAYMPQNTYLFDMTVLDNVMMGLKNQGYPPAERRKLAMHAIDSVGMGGFCKAKAKSLSGGEAQRVALARTLVLSRDLVLLDEPASSTDIAGMETVEKYIMEVHKKDGSTIVFTTHNPSQAIRIADEAVIMQAGYIIEKNKTQNIFDSPQMQETKDFLRSWRI